MQIHTVRGQCLIVTDLKLIKIRTIENCKYHATIKPSKKKTVLVQNACGANPQCARSKDSLYSE